MIEEIYKVGLDKFEGNHEKAAEFTKGFLKEAMAIPWGEVGKQVAGGVGKALGGGVAALGLGLGIAGLSATMNGVANSNLRSRFEAALARAIAGNSVLQGADKARLHSYANTIFKFAPTVACDANLLANVLTSAIHGESMDLTTIRSLADLESRTLETRKNSLFSPKAFV